MFYLNNLHFATVKDEPDTTFSLNIFNKQYRDLPLTLEDPTRFILDSGIDMSFFRTYEALLDSGKAFARGILDQDKIYKNRYPLYMTINIRIERRFNFKKSHLYLYLGAINLLNRKNLNRYFWNRIENKEDSLNQIPILPVFGIEYNF